MKNSESIENYIEDIRSPIWVYLILGFTMGTNSAIITGVFFVSVINDPLLSGFQSYFFYVAFLFGALISFYSLVWLTHVKIRCEGDFLFVEKGRKKVKFNINSVDRVVKVDHTTRRKGSKTFMALFCRTALKVAYRNDDGSYNLIFSTNKPEYLIQLLGAKKIRK
jgi:hypothetical protein|tara:strand:+ start:423 stop:917 length:495 start_codon:yes stop_codon:yes gene_type:complete